MRLTSYGAAAEVTGSCHLLEVGDHRVLLDCGMFQGGRKSSERNYESFGFDPASIDAVVLSHAHIDHSGRIPFLINEGFTGSIYTHAVSCELADILLLDSAFLNEKRTERNNRNREKENEPDFQPLYTQADAERAMLQFRPLQYDQKLQVAPGITINLKDAGHILGSAIVELFLEENGVSRKLVFSGDLGQANVPILNDPEFITEADLVIMESTYGDRLHKSSEDTRAEMLEVISEATQGRGNILIPAFAVGRSQLMLYWMARHYKDAGLDNWQVFLDSPLAIKATEIYTRHNELYDVAAKQMWQAGKGHPLLPNLKISRTTEESMAINNIRSGAIIIAGSGMCTGGRIQHHLKNHAGNRDCQIIIAGYQAEGTPGRMIVDGAKEIRLYGKTLKIAAKVHTIGGLSAHADQAGLLNWYSHFNGRPKVALVHGEPDQQQKLADRLREDFAAEVHFMLPGQPVELVSSGAQ